MKYPDAISDELGVIGHCLEFGLDTALVAVEHLPIEAMLHPGCRDALHLIEDLATGGHPVNPYTLLMKWKERFGTTPPTEILDSVKEAVTPEVIHYHIEGIVEAWRKRRLMEICSRILEKAETLKADDLLAQAEMMLREESPASANVLDGKAIAEVLQEDLERRYALDGGLSGVPTPFTHLNALTEGLQYGEQIIIGARPSHGKTALGLDLCAYACFVHSHPVLFVSLEMGSAAIGRRLLSAWSSVALKQIRKGTYDQSDFFSFVKFFAFLNKKSFYLFDAVGGIAVNRLCATVRRYVQRHGVKLVVVDYLQKIRSEKKGEKRTYEIEEVCDGLKALASQTNCALVLLAQLNREPDKGSKRPPRLSDLGDSKSIEQAGDLICLLDRDRADNPEEALLMVAKQRDGECDTVKLRFNTRLCKFENP